ncbi:branched-chain amino acid ABC transporter permease [Rhodopseudomonas palustris]|uniref:branched-chain amino acid ABC transporter permease n=1 Tax=Rhodopseudomonas palustris TaxID=1076 RepID=UPI002ACEE389|nr:branched-chain amino acid ABC transporter permease [Rhodopseudomonas palustris]WQG97802.1 branched-chain amino acid ABC transporter permease [Rhodopseudomonas palustris]
MTEPRWTSYAVLVAIALLAALPLMTGSNYIVGIAISGLIFLAAAASLNLVYGYAGQLSFAQLGFWGVGGYCAAIAVVDLGQSFWFGIAFAGVVNLLLSTVIGIVITRTTRHAFVVVTLTFALLAGLIARDWVGVTRGPLGIPGLPPPSLMGFAFDTSARFYYIALVFALIALAFLYSLKTSRIGLILKAVKQNAPLVESQGIAPGPYKLAAFVIASVITGMAGGIYAFNLKVIDPSFLDFYYMQTFLIIVIIGGAGSFWAVVLAGAAMVVLPEALRFSNELRMVIYGVVLVAVMMFMPRGVSGWLEDRRIAALRKALR